MHLDAHYVTRAGRPGVPFAIERGRVGGRDVSDAPEVVAGMIARNLEWLVQGIHMHLRK